MKEVTLEELQQLCTVLQFLTPRQRNHLIKTMTKGQMHILEVACFNLATNHDGLNKKQLAELRKYKKPVEIVASKSYSLVDKRRTAQKGGFIPALLPIVGTLVTSFLS